KSTMKTNLYITIIFSLFFSYLTVGQIHSKTLNLTRYCRNYIEIDNRFYINLDDNPDFSISNSDYWKSDVANQYKITPYVESSETELIIRSKKDKKKHYISCYLKNPKVK